VTRITPILLINNFGRLFSLSLWIGLPNFTFVALPIPEILGGTLKIWESRDQVTPFLEKKSGVLLRLSRWIVLPNFTFVALPVPKILGGTFKILGVTLPGPRPVCWKNNYGHLFSLSLWIGLPNFTFVALPVREILEGSLKILGVTLQATPLFREK